MKILIIEDDLEIRSPLQDMLEIHGHTVLAAANGLEGIKLAETLPDLIFCDIAMPSMGGYEVLTNIRQLPRCQDIPFVFLTARANRADQRYGMSLGADDYITKPFSERDILDAIAARTRRQQPLRERVDRLLIERLNVTDTPWAHELMMPLCNILGALELIEAELGTIEPGEFKKLLALIRDGAERQHALSKKLVIYQELERMKAAVPRTATRCLDVPLVIGVGARRAATEEKRSDDLVLQCDPGTLPLKEAHLLTAVAELAGNAFRFSQPGQAVSVTGTRRGARYSIEVAARSTDLSPAQRASVDAFLQSGRDDPAQTGLGLGLAVVRCMAEITGGQLSLHTGAGVQGLKIVLELPCL